MVRSPKSRGKGSRRYPGRPGGARKRKPIGPWKKRCQHTVSDIRELPQPVTQLNYCGIWCKKPKERAYLFDQEMAKLGISYHAAVTIVFCRRGLLITIPSAQSPQVSEVIAKLESH